MQRSTVIMALHMLEAADAPRTTVQTPFTWPEDGDWRANYMRVDDSNLKVLRRVGIERRRQQLRHKSEGRTTET